MTIVSFLLGVIMSEKTLSSSCSRSLQTKPNILINHSGQRFWNVAGILNFSILIDRSMFVCLLLPPIDLLTTRWIHSTFETPPTQPEYQLNLEATKCWASKSVPQSGPNSFQNLGLRKLNFVGLWDFKNGGWILYGLSPTWLLMAGMEVIWFWLRAVLQKPCSWSSSIQNTIGNFLEVLRFEPGAAGWKVRLHLCVLPDPPQ